MKSSLRVALEALAERAREAEERVMSAEELELFDDERSASARASLLAAVVRVGRRHGVAGIARLLGIQASYTSNVVRDLEERGLVHRVVREGSNRHAILLTREGAQALAAAEQHDQRVLDVVLAELTLEERTAFVATMEKLSMDLAPDSEASPSQDDGDEDD
jgi:DNA-binding MarR family transcriptional regulator